MTGSNDWQDLGEGLRAYPIDKSIQVKLVKYSSEVEINLQSKVDEIWQRAVFDQDLNLFDGSLLSVLSVTPDRVDVHQAQYRYFYAQSQEAALFQSLNVRPLACSGILVCRDGLVLARRGPKVFLDSNKWELAPSGTLDSESVGQDGVVNESNFLLREMKEELGIEISIAGIEGIVGLYEDLSLHNFDIVIRINVDLGAAEIHTLFEDTDNDEYDLVEVVSIDRLTAFVEQNETSFVTLSRQILRQHFDQ